MKRKLLALIFMKTYIRNCIILVLFFSAEGLVKGQSYFEKALKNTQSGRYLNTWILVNESETKDSIRLVSGKSGDTLYSEIQGESQVYQTKNLYLVVDHQEKMIVASPRKAAKKIKTTLWQEDILADTLEMLNTTSENGIAKDICLFKQKSEGQEFLWAIDTANNLVKWFETTQTEFGPDEEAPVYTEKLSSVKIKYILADHQNQPEVLSGTMNPANIVKGKSQSYSLTPRYQNYEFINFFEQ